MLKGRLGDDFSAVDVVLHEIGHASYNRVMRDNPSIMRSFELDASNPKAKGAMEEAIVTMYGGRTKQAQEAIDAIVPERVMLM